MKSERITLQDIADMTHVSKALVSRVLNNRPVRVSTQKREQILKIANELDYMPSGQILAANPLPYLHKTIALILPHLNGKFMCTITEVITKKAYENGYSTLIFDYRQDSTLEMKYLNLCHSLNVSGIILDSITNANNNDKYIQKMFEWGIPILFLDCYPNTADVSVISSKNKESMFRLTESLIARGHTNILSIIQDKSTLTNVSMERLNGYYEAMDNHGLLGFNEIIYPDRDFQQQPIFSLLSSSARFTAFLIHTGSDVEHFCKLIRSTKYGSELPYELAVFDDFNITYRDYISGTNNDVYQRIACIMSQRPSEIATKAVDTLIDNIKKGENYIPARTFIDCDLIFLNPNNIMKEAVEDEREKA